MQITALKTAYSLDSLYFLKHGGEYVGCVFLSLGADDFWKELPIDSNSLFFTNSRLSMLLAPKGWERWRYLKSCHSRSNGTANGYGVIVMVAECVCAIFMSNLVLSLSIDKKCMVLTSLDTKSRC